MKKSILLIIFVLIIIMLIFGSIEVNAITINDLPSLMENASTVDKDDAGTKIGTSINKVIGLLQVSGTGIALIVVTLLGIKYIMASPSEKADTKKAIMPVLIGCFLLFGAVNLVAIVANFSLVIK